MRLTKDLKYWGSRGDQVLSIENVVYVIFQVMMWLIAIRCILSFIRHDPYQPIIRFIYEVTEPVMAPFRRLMPTAGGIDFSPIVVFFVLYLLQSLIISVIRMF